MYEVWLKSNGTGRPADMMEEPQTIETHDTSKCMHGMNQTEAEYSRLARGPKEQVLAKSAQ